jgi:hypothetical protein
MLQVSITSAWRQGVAAIVLIGAVALGLAVRPASPGEPLGHADDYGTRHASIANAVELSEVDDYGTRLITKPALGPQDDFGTRHATVATPLTEVDDYGTRNDGR